MEITLTNPSAPVLDESAAVKALGALAQAQRLRAFRALVVAGLEGLTPGTMAEQLGVAPSALSFHLKELVYSGLVSSEARGRNLIYRADFAHMTALLSYMTKHCCQGEACAVTTDAGCATC
ncbi:MAG: transcriptional regulator [Polaromonas sp. 39-63-203]|jgi:DNA-binding transcriptional ArsR family regulator|uniref:ArsR/SmtB family transcription factor n=1 Tax=Polaromonas sp. TaxID=1869339 RepID=UPI000BC82B4E|nr:metalloregulator ArsR/SmtB family transcription factor [Polaromonas sp.]OYY52269.1 MAG: transcriptional regulator [Polaromonas sp. 35-63-240]OYY97862.1 MAG: transcriptional regulator [Polaromonas sp. 28-63-22]OYZ84289.1 MAG: transcriptional regulator [Polaromonas sp. 24-62-144]OZA97804.1 MAG: transcriptional regulator [Polaromonas sp. 39-63-203]HQS31219.1 metalloregulator ArsR/SmtB family transcription factor [Polaromonas sp.]